MDSHLSEEAQWASGLASRLRLIQANFADDPATVRQGYITEEIERAIKPISPTRRKAYLDSLAERFPSWDGTRSTAGSDVKDVAVAAAPLTAEELVARLVELAPTLSPEARTAFATQLQVVGLSIKEAANVFLALPADLQKKLGVPAGKPLQLERAVKVLAITAEVTLKMDQLAWALWKQVARQSVVKKEGELPKLAGPYLAGDPEISAAQVAQPVEQTRKLIAALLGAVGRAGSLYANDYARNMAPDALEDWAKMEKKTFESVEAACWRKFKQQAAEHATQQAIEKRIQDAIVKAAENLMLGRAAG